MEVQKQNEMKQAGWKIIDGKRYYLQKDGSIAKPDQSVFFWPDEGA
ncbi:hypothetical protein [Bacillus sp. 196mf]|nr:hypothetical protein [Bacillus sp. 196mf]